MIHRASVAAVLAATIFCVRAPAVGSDVPDVEAVQQHVRDATGKRPVAEHLTVSYDAFGLHGTRVTARKGEDYRETIHDGPFTTANGAFHGQEWHQNANGQTVLDEADQGRAVPEHYASTVAPITTPVVGFAISSLNKRGEGTKEYIDSSSWHVVRRDYISATETTVYTYDDFRTVSGHTQAWHWTARDGHPENDAENRIQSEDAGPVSDADVAIAPPRRELVEYPSGKTTVPLPVRLDRDKFIVRIDIGSRGYDFMLDTGSYSIAIDDSVVRELGLKTYGLSSSAANAGRYASTSAIVPEMRVGALTMHDVVVDTIPHLDDDQPGEYKIVGLLGFDFIASLVLKMDYEHGQVTAMDPATFEPPKDPLTNALNVRLGSGQPMTDVLINGALGERFIVDTGGGLAVLVFDYFARRHPEAIVDTVFGGGRSDKDYGVGGVFDVKRYRLASVKVGNVNFKDFDADVVVSSHSYDGDSDGLIGSSFLSLYTLYTDYQNSMLYLVPNEFGRAGIVRGKH